MSSAAPHVGDLLLAVLRQSRRPGREWRRPRGYARTPSEPGRLTHAISAALELIEKAIAEPDGHDGHYAPWQFAALAVLLEARDRVNVQPAVDFDRPFLAVWPAARARSRRREGR